MNDSQNGSNPTQQKPVAKIIPCMHCKQDLVIPQARSIFMNGLEASVIIVPHLESIICVSCHAIYNLRISEETKVRIDLQCVVAPERNIVTLDDIRGNDPILPH